MPRLNATALILLLSLLVGGRLFGQTFPKEQGDLFWNGRNLICSDAGEIRIESVNLAPRQLKIPADFHCVHFADGFYWANQDIRTAREREIRVLRSSDGIHWHTHTKWVVSKDHPGCRIFALGSSFVGISVMAPFPGDAPRSMIAVLEEGRTSALEVKNTIDMKTSGHVPSLFVPKVVQISDGWAIVNFRTGHIWTIQASEGGYRTRAAKLFDKIKDEALDALEGVESPILGCQPNSNGSLLIVSRSEDAALHARRYAKQLRRELDPEQAKPGYGFLDPELRKDPSAETRAKIEKHFDDLAARKKALDDQIGPKVLDAYPELLWWIMDPSNGRIKACPVPEGAPSKLLSIDIFEKFRFRFQLDGTVTVG